MGVFTAREALALLETAEALEKAGDSEYINKDKTFKGGFKGCMRYQQERKGLSESSARKLCAYIGRRAGRIP